MNLSLYELANEFSQLENMVYEDAPDLEAYLNELLVKKTDGYCQFVEKLEGEILLASERIKKLQDFKRSRENAIERLKDYAYQAMKHMGKDKITGDMGSISIRKPSEKLLITDENKIPKEFVSYTRVIDNAGLKKAIQCGDEIEGARVVEGNRSITIKLKGVK